MNSLLIQFLTAKHSHHQYKPVPSAPFQTTTVRKTIDLKLVYYTTFAGRLHPSIKERKSTYWRNSTLQCLFYRRIWLENEQYLQIQPYVLFFIRPLTNPLTMPQIQTYPKSLPNRRKCHIKVQSTNAT